MANHYSHAALPYPIRGAKYTVDWAFPNPENGTPILSAEVSKDFGAFATATETPGSISGPALSGVAYITLTATEMTAAVVICHLKNGLPDIPPAFVTLQPRNLQVIISGTASAGSSLSITLAASATGYENAIVLTTGGTGSGQARMIKSVSGNACTVAESWETNPDATTTYAILRTEFMAGTAGGGGGPTAGEIADAVCDEALSGHTTAGTLGKVLADAATQAKALDIETDTQNIQTRLPAALIGGRMDSDIVAISGDTAAADLLESVLDGGGGTLTFTLDGNISGDVQGDVNGNVNGLVGGIGLAGISSATFAAGAINAAAIASNAIDADALATDAVTELVNAIWANVTRTLTSGVNIALAKGVGVTGFNDLDAAGVRSAVGLASADLDTQLSTIDNFIDTEIAAIKAKTDNLPNDPADASDITTAFNSLNTKIDTIDDFLDTEIAAIKAKTDLLPASPAAVGDIPTANQNADALLDRTNAVAGKTPRETLRIVGAMLSGTTTDAGTASEKFKDFQGNLCVTVTVTPAGERTTVVFA